MKPNTPKHKEHNRFSLIELPLNKLAKIDHIEAGFRATQRLSGMGLTPNTKIKKVGEAPFHGPIQIEVRGTRLALGRGLANKIYIILEESDKE